MASLFKVKALYEFDAKEDDDLGFPAGQILEVTEEVDDNWLEGKYIDSDGHIHSGIFPREFVEKYEPEVPARPSRPSRPKQEPASSTAPPPAPEPDSEESGLRDQVPLTRVTSASQARPLDLSADTFADEVKSPPSAVGPKSPPSGHEPSTAPRPAPVEPSPSAGSKKPPPVAAKSNAFRDRIAAFNQSAAAPVAPIGPGGPKPQSTGFIKKPFVAPPPMANTYVPPPKVEAVHRPYIREEDPEIKRRQEEDRAAAEAAGMTAQAQTESQEDETAPQPTSLKERIARLQQQQLEQAQRRSEVSQKKEKKSPVKKSSQSSDQVVDDEAADGEDPDETNARVDGSRSLDMSRESRRLSSTQRRPQDLLSSNPAAPEHELVSDGNDADQSAAGETTEDDTGTIGPDDSDEHHAPVAPSRHMAAPKREPDVGDEDDTTEDAREEDDEDEEGSMDEETRRRIELRERMAKMSGGMGMAGMFGGGMPMPSGAPKKRGSKDKKTEETASTSPPAQQRVPMIPVPGLTRMQSPASDQVDVTAGKEGLIAEDRGDEDALPVSSTRKSMGEDRGVPPPVPRDSHPSVERGPPPVPVGSAMPTPRPTASDSRPVPQSTSAPMSPGPGSESDDEASIHPPKSGEDTSRDGTPGPLPTRTNTGGAPPVPSLAAASSAENKRTSYFGIDAPSTTSDKRASRPPPPIPGTPLTSPRPPPPPPPAQLPGRSGTTQENDNMQRESDYEGDYDTDIASSAKRKDALKAHAREPSLDDSTTGPETPLSSPPPPPPLHNSAPRTVPPPPPPSNLPKSRPSMDAPRAPPPIPPTAPLQTMEDEVDDYDPYRYDGQAARSPPPPVPVGMPPVGPLAPEPAQESSADDLYATDATKTFTDRPPAAPPRDRVVPTSSQEATSQSVRAPPRQSLDIPRTSTNIRRSMEQARPSSDIGQIAQDLPLNEDIQWWTAERPLPPILQNRAGVDILSESEESSISKRGGRKEISKDIYVLFMDYSQTHVNARFDASDPSDVVLEQKHLPPPPKLRQDQLETYWQRFGKSIADVANSIGNSKKESIVGDGSSSALVSELIKSQAEALQPVGCRAYGSLVYSNLANASTMQFDEIRPGDIVTLRNARFEGSHGAMKHKYKQEYGASHVAIVEEWDGTRRAIRGWEQGREKKDRGVRSEKFRLGDLKSGEVRVWRIVGRDWVDWQS